jgi:hypothetical protein
MVHFGNDCNKQHFLFPYADNWAWIAQCPEAIFYAWIKALNLATALKLIISISKSWAWTTTKKWF